VILGLWEATTPSAWQVFGKKEPIFGPKSQKSAKTMNFPLKSGKSGVFEREGDVFLQALFFVGAEAFP